MRVITWVLFSTINSSYSYEHRPVHGNKRRHTSLTCSKTTGFVHTSDICVFWWKHLVKASKMMTDTYFAPKIIDNTKLQPPRRHRQIQIQIQKKFIVKKCTHTLTSHTIYKYNPFLNNWERHLLVYLSPYLLHSQIVYNRTGCIKKQTNKTNQ